MGRNPHMPNRDQVRTLTIKALEALGGRARRQEVIGKALELGDFTDCQLAVPPPPSHPRYGSLIGYWLSWSLTENKKAGLLQNPDRNVWSLPGQDG
jgi:hypothetical protein